MLCMKDVVHFADMVEGQQGYQLFQYHCTACSPQHSRSGLCLSDGSVQLGRLKVLGAQNLGNSS